MVEKYVVILGAGRGSRMESRDPNHSKVAYPILGKPLINYVIDACKAIKPKEIYTVVGYGGKHTEECVKDHSKVVWQKEILGTGHALKQVKELADKEGDVNPTGYGRILRERGSYRLLEIREDKDCNEEEAEINEVNAGIYIINNKLLQEYLPKLSPNNAKHEYYLSELVKLFREQGLPVEAYVLEDAQDIFCVSDRTQLAYAAKVIRKRVNKQLMLSGVSIEDPDTAYISPEAVVGRDTVIMPNTTLLGKCKVGEGCYIGPNTTLIDVKVGNDAHVKLCYLEKMTVKDGEHVGPYYTNRK